MTEITQEQFADLLCLAGEARLESATALNPWKHFHKIQRAKRESDGMPVLQFCSTDDEKCGFITLDPRFTQETGYHYYQNEEANATIVQWMDSDSKIHRITFALLG